MDMDVDMEFDKASANILAGCNSIRMLEMIHSNLESSICSHEVSLKSPLEIHLPLPGAAAFPEAALKR
ncbi:GL27235 [Drosophila persimilis]|uniref:GL27235 n=1 Tax=Drosophila persimilis TaxID=7234 RepID=B4GYU4_DROPE|nr:GL27235 [Drosophila persimilis]